MIRRAASVWVAGVGAALLIVSAALFVAVQWNNIPDFAKLAIILVVTGAFLFAGHRLKRTLPATGDVLFHLGAFLLPVDLAAVNLRVGWSWRELLLAEGLLGVTAFFGLGLLDESRVLRVAASVSVVATALGIGANTPVPSPVALSAFALFMAFWFPRSRSASVWAVIAGYLPVFALPFVRLPALDFAFPREPIGVLVAGVLSAAVLIFAAHIERDIRRALLGIGALVASGSTAWLVAGLPHRADLLAPFGAFVVIELVAYALRRDEFWARPWSVVRVGAESLAVVATIAVFFIDRSPDNFLRAACLGLGWGIATLSYQGRFARLSGVAAAFSAVAAVELLTTDPWLVGASLLIAAGLLLEVRDQITDAGAVLMLVRLDPHFGVLFGLFAAALLVRRARGMLVDGSRRPGAALVVSATVALAQGAFASRTDLFLMTLVFAGACWAMAVVLDYADGWVALIPRAAALLSLIAAVSFTPSQRLALSALLVAQFAFDSVRLRAPVVAYGAVIPLQLAVFDVGMIAGVRLPYIGLMCCVAAVVYAGLASVVDTHWRVPLFACAISATAVGAVLSAADAVTFGIALMIFGAIVLSIAFLERVVGLGYVGGALIVVGAMTELGAAHVTAAEAYMAPVALYLLAMGFVIRRTREFSSWQAYAPATLMFGATALIERIGGGAGWHSVVAGSAGVIAVAVGGSRRLAGPLFAGTALLASVVGFESMAVAATVPTWAWLAIGGSALLATGIALERSERSPFATGRRVVDVIGANFS